MSPFKFKKFSVSQDRTAMKIGTDGVLLGAWANIDHDPNSILDIGTGTGIIALMLAQRSQAELIDALEIDPDAYEQGVENFENSDWGDRLFCYHASFAEFVEEMKTEQEYDLIVSNPPFYEPPLTPPKGEDLISEARKNARFYDSLPFGDLLQGVSFLLSESGIFSVIIPKKEEENFIAIAESFDLQPNRITHIKGTPTSEIKRSLIDFSFQKKETKPEILVIEKSRHDYTEDYITLVKDFYLKM
ncbi:MAG TPA: methyltransferase [Salinimicrobium sp.]|nr:methyltransferase [Salinimicrobium sp.]